MQDMKNPCIILDNVVCEGDIAIADVLPAPSIHTGGDLLERVTESGVWPSRAKSA